MTHLSALPLLVPFVAGPLLVLVGYFAPRVFNDAVGAVSAVGVTALCCLLAVHAVSHPFPYWLGGWTPRHGVTIGISLSIDVPGAGLAAFSGLLVTAALVYSFKYFEAVEGLYHGLMLLFMAGMVGFCLTGDLFNLIVFFELMSVAAYTLTAYRIEDKGPIQGAINFAITNSIGGFAVFIGAALLYARTGALNMAQIGAALGTQHADPLIIVAMVLLFLGFLTKASVVPFHFWTADAEAVAPIPVCVLFSGAMVELGIYAVARLYWVIFAGPMAAHEAAVRAIFVAVGVVTALVGGTMCVLQRHVKRLLAFSTIGHVGMLVCGVALLDPKALAGVGTYIVGHGLTKGALFMCAGVLLHRFSTIDEYDLHGRGRAVPVAGVLMAVGALLLASIPPFTTFMGKSLLEESSSTLGFNWLIAVYIFVSAMTGGAVLRVTGRVFLGWGPSEGPPSAQVAAAREESSEEEGSREHTPLVMIVTPAVLLVGALLLGLIPGAVPGLERLTALFVEHSAYPQWVLRSAHVAPPVLPPSHVSLADYVYGAAGVAGAFVVAGLGLFGRPLRARLPRLVARPGEAAAGLLRQVHSGHIADYITWWTVGVSVVGGVCLVALR